MDGADEDGWSAVAGVWAELWGDFADPARQRVISETGIGPGSRVLDVGCGSGEFLGMLDRLGATPAGIDPAPAMIALARARLPTADIRLGSAEGMPWPAATFDVVTAFNALQFAEDTLDALHEFVRVTAPNGLVAVSNWAEGARNDLNVIETSVALAAGEELRPDGELRQAGGLEELFGDAGLDVISAGLVEVCWEAPNDEVLVRGVLMGEDPDTIAATAATVIDAARPFRIEGGGYRLVNAFRYAIGRTGPQATTPARNSSPSS
ncbi:class I SAM-dependent methyltransferase [Glaciibacter superstes]|uniref:class I SAM-dependent methyltransferase n=1 Tax=Glaciibacter superstes TaxID=501023 RepID=UPI0003B498B6|nr:class I SAM-dependent methyltransferase [Glaciibacter superstes]